MVTLHFTMIMTVDEETLPTHIVNTFTDRITAEDIMHSIEKGVFDDDYVKYTVNKIVYELEEA